MNEITRIHLAGTPYNIELAAKKELEAYLEAIKLSLHADPDTMREIESRMVELLAAQGVAVDDVITSSDFQKVHGQLGEPQDFADEDSENLPARTGDMDTQDKPKKRLMRDPQNAMIGGVCSGLAAYFGFDTVWVRLAFGVLLILTSGFMVPVYILMWIVMPEAKTTTDRLEMSGEPVTLSSIKDHASDMPAKSGEPVLVKILRYLFGLGFVGGAVTAMLATISVVALTIMHRHDIFMRDNISWIPLSMGLMAMGGTLLAVLLGLTAYVCFIKYASRNIVIALVVTTVLGMASFASGGITAATRVHEYQTDLASSKVTAPVDIKSSLTPEVSKLKISLNSPYPTDVVYEVTSDKPSAKIEYNSRLSSKPVLTFERTDETLVVRGTLEGDVPCRNEFFMTCYGGANNSVLYIYGPALQSIDSDVSMLTYRTSNQNSLEAVITNKSKLGLVSSGTIEKLTATVGTGASLDASRATIGSSEMKSSANSYVNFGELQHLNLAAPETCSDNRGDVAVTAMHTSDIMINGKQWRDGSNIPCLTVNDDRGAGFYVDLGSE